MTDTRSPYLVVLDDAVEEFSLTPDQVTMLHLNFNRCLNMTGGRPSDAARSEVWALRREGVDAYFAKFDEVRKGDVR
jgi:hypothetical protein